VIKPVHHDSESLDSYEQALVESDWLKRFPFEHTSRNVPHEQFVRRLLQERGLFVGGALSLGLPINVVIIADRALSRFERTLESCFLQSASGFIITVVSHEPRILKQAQHYCEERIAAEGRLQSVFGERVFYRESISDCARNFDGYIIVIRSGDVLHLSCVTCVYLELSREEVNVCLWNEMEVDFSEGAQLRKLIRKPQLEPYTFYHFNYIGESFAFRTEILSWFSQIDRCFFEGDVHYFLLSTLQNSKYRFATIPQYLLLRDVQNVRNQLSPLRLEPYRDYFAKAGFAFNCLEPGRYSLLPNNRARKISVVIPFRDEPELTWRAVESVMTQDVDAAIELVLIDNQSSPPTVQAIDDLVKRLEAPSRSLQLLRYDQPFNHSAQCNLGARHAQGECLVFMNNDAQLLSPNALVEMAAWSLLPDVGTVGARMLHNLDGKSLSAGITARLVVGSEFNSPVQESHDMEFANVNRETWGNSFACAAISKKKFEMLGPLDEVDFPNGYNDVDYSMRCRKLGLVNMYLGTISVYHKPGSSRGRYDEIHQKVLLRRKFPEICTDGLFQLDTKRVLRDG
jgi:GT2 family glycosyltransferase